mgnify:CR=1 FL=1
MKQIFLVVFTGVLLFSSLLAQNKLFIPFGQSADDVRQFLETRDYVLDIQEHHDLLTMMVDVDEGKRVEYAFDAEGRHYATTVTRTYADARQSIKFRENSLEYMKMVSKNQVERNSYGRIVCHTAVGSESIFKFFVISHGNTQTLQLTSISRSIGPAQRSDLTRYEAKILSKGLANQ